MPRKKNEEALKNAVETAAQEPEITETTDTAEAPQEPEAAMAEGVASGGENRCEDDGYVSYCLPFLPGVRPGDYQTVTINGKNYQVKYGETVRMPKGVADVLKEMVKSRTLVEKKIEKLQEETCITTLK